MSRPTTNYKLTFQRFGYVVLGYQISLLMTMWVIVSVAAVKMSQLIIVIYYTR